MIDETEKQETELAEYVEEQASSKAKPKKNGNAKKKNTKSEAGLVNYEKEEVEKLIAKLAKDIDNSSEIGRALRDNYGIPDVKAFGFTIGQALKKHGIQKEIPEDLYNLIKKAVIMHNHLQRNKKDSKNVHRLQLIESRVRKIGRYYVKVGKLPKGWKYNMEQAKLMVK